mmetsp:Transcript_20631/g.24783  ORF Transcript_20631/g.24783 Transcript_20631/m.24783 type:complete len:115 (-) Transcript_20631:723-1067(-)|eukprot:CAMPEP_0197850534 /NCGR_PEP_ID=MMETSP1438-20131217/15640_1 /TAXON_ID=1461541 /ORGANISM="Pterosperma sp., Strain CCMP1384" /LENGTH=114 /DNA_ID=CAMNT_0043463743 /DNA_START=198 /DNA_END=542 /DNA_ORIENTATION=-
MPKIYFPNIPLILKRPATLAAAQGAQELVFKTVPSVGKVQIKRFLQSVYDLDVMKVHTINYEGKKKRDRLNPMLSRRDPDWKQVYVVLANPIDLPDHVKAKIESQESEPPAETK